MRWRRQPGGPAGPVHPFDGQLARPEMRLNVSDEELVERWDENVQGQSAAWTTTSHVCRAKAPRSVPLTACPRHEGLPGEVSPHGLMPRAKPQSVRLVSSCCLCPLTPGRFREQRHGSDRPLRSGMFGAADVGSGSSQAGQGSRDRSFNESDGPASAIGLRFLLAVPAEAVWKLSRGDRATAFRCCFGVRATGT